MPWLPITEALPSDACPRCDHGELYVRSSRSANARWQAQYLWCNKCPATFKARADRRFLSRARKVL
jgi:hypothetical protein